MTSPTTRWALFLCLSQNQLIGYALIEKTGSAKDEEMGPTIKPKAWWEYSSLEQPLMSSQPTVLLLK